VELLLHHHNAIHEQGAAAIGHYVVNFLDAAAFFGLLQNGKGFVFAGLFVKAKYFLTGGYLAYFLVSIG
jgi:hypothetical protein